MGRKTKTSFEKSNKKAKGSKSRKTQPSMEGMDFKGLKLTREMLTRYLTQCTHLTMDELKALERNQTLSWFQRRVAKMLIKDFTSAGLHGIGQVMDLINGPQAQRIEVDATNRYASMSDEELLIEKRRLSEINAARIKQLEMGPKFYENLIEIRNAREAACAREVTPLVAIPNPGNTGEPTT